MSDLHTSQTATTHNSINHYMTPLPPPTHTANCIHPCRTDSFHTVTHRQPHIPERRKDSAPPTVSMSSPSRGWLYSAPHA